MPGYPRKKRVLRAQILRLRELVFEMFVLLKKHGAYANVIGIEKQAELTAQNILLFVHWLYGFCKRRANGKSGVVFQTFLFRRGCVCCQNQIAKTLVGVRPKSDNREFFYTAFYLIAGGGNYFHWLEDSLFTTIITSAHSREKRMARSRTSFQVI